MDDKKDKIKNSENDLKKKLEKIKEISKQSDKLFKQIIFELKKQNEKN